MNKSVEYIKHVYHDLYELLMPSPQSISLTKELWAEWEKAGIESPNIDEIAMNATEQESKFFYEIVAITEKIAKRELAIDYCPFVTNEYNLSAVSADEGYLVLIDESFFKILFFLTNILVFDMEGLIEKKEQLEISVVIKNMIDSYFDLRFSDFNQDIITSLMKQDYELTEFASYFFQLMKIFMIAHEISHHILGHTNGILEKKYKFNNEEIAIKIDEIDNKSYEIDADIYAYKIFTEILNTVDDSVNYIYCKYKIEFAPIFLFDILKIFDRLHEIKSGKPLQYVTHPSPDERKSILLKCFEIKHHGNLYENILASLNKTIDLKRY